MRKIRKRLSSNPLPRYWKEICPEASDRWDIGFHGCSIKVKLLVFKDAKLANKFLWRMFKYRMPQDCLGLSWELSCDVYGWNGDKPYHVHEYDKNYIGFIVLLKDHLRLEVIAHECCHTAFSYSRRLRHKWPDVDHNPDEAVCYPLGKLTAQVCSALKSGGYEIIGNHGVFH